MAQVQPNFVAQYPNNNNNNGSPVAPHFAAQFPGYYGNVAAFQPIPVVGMPPYGYRVPHMDGQDFVNQPYDDCDQPCFNSGCSDVSEHEGSELYDEQMNFKSYDFMNYNEPYYYNDSNPDEYYSDDCNDTEEFEQEEEVRQEDTNRVTFYIHNPYTFAAYDYFCANN